MSSSAGCEHVRGIAGELALGALEGEQRAEALEHLAACESCSRAVAELTRVTDELLALAPPEEPPAGFELRVLKRFRPEVRAPRSRRLAVTAAASLAAAAVTAVALVVAFHGDRELASEYRASESHGKYFRAARLYGTGTVPRGAAFGYRGSPSWVFVTVEHPQRAGRYRCELVTRGGGHILLRFFDLDGGTRSWAVAIPVDLDRVGAIRLVHTGRGNVLTARFEHE